MTFKLHRDAEKYLSKLSANQITRILTAIQKLPNGDVKRLRGREDEMRLRVGDWRIIFIYLENGVFVKEIGSRGGIYKK